MDCRLRRSRPDLNEMRRGALRRPSPGDQAARELDLRGNATAVRDIGIGPKLLSLSRGGRAWRLPAWGRRNPPEGCRHSVPGSATGACSTFRATAGQQFGRPVIQHRPWLPRNRQHCPPPTAPGPWLGGQVVIPPYDRMAASPPLPFPLCPPHRRRGPHDVTNQGLANPFWKPSSRRSRTFTPRSSESRRRLLAGGCRWTTAGSAASSRGKLPSFEGEVRGADHGQILRPSQARLMPAGPSSATSRAAERL